jgi:hypothetical protein
MATKYEKMRALIEKETAWSRGSDRPWQGDALTTPWFLDRLAFLAANAPDHLIEDLIAKCAEADV